MSTGPLRYTFPKKPSPNAFAAFVDKLPYCSRDIVSFDADSTKREYVDIHLREGADRAQLAQQVDQYFKKIARGSFRVSTEIVVDRREAKPLHHEPVGRELIERRWLIPYADGCVALQGPGLALYQYFDQKFVSIAGEFDAVRMSFPTLISIDTLNTANYLTSFPHHITLAPHMIGEIESIETFQTNVVSQGPLLCTAEEPDHVLSPTVCIHCYRAIQGRALAEGEMLRATAIGNCFRHEMGRLDHGTRLWDFNMREIIFIGTNADVGAARQRSIEEVSSWLDSLGMCYWIETATDPFFIDNYSAQSFFQLANKTKYELLVAVPGAERPLAIGSFNIHHDFFGKAFEITVPSASTDNTDNTDNTGKEGDSTKTYADTGCTAFGVERFVFGFVAQFGFDMTRWPESVQQHMATWNTRCL